MQSQGSDEHRRVVEQFATDLNFVLSLMGGLLFIFFFLFVLTSPEAAWRCIGLPVKKRSSAERSSHRSHSRKK